MSRQAVVVIHGIGEEKPMGTLRRFVSAVLGRAGDGRDAYFSKPDTMSELFELRRLQSAGRASAHFYEYYWAYNVSGTKIGDVIAWLADLLLRLPRNVPRSARSLWLLCWVLVLTAAALFLYGAFDVVVETQKYGFKWLVLSGVVALVQYFLISYIGDAARYLRPAPRNIKLRQKIRSEGVKLLRTLIERGDYERIVVVGHSLGSVIAYDIISRLWLDYNEELAALGDDSVRDNVARLLAAGVPPQEHLRKKVVAAGDALAGGDYAAALGAFQEEQREAWRELRAYGNKWSITDLVTAGCPIVHAMLLVADSAADFKMRKGQRELPTCPPQKDENGYGYPKRPPVTVGAERHPFSPIVPHHAAPFAVTRWTNLYFPAYFGLFGDFVGGPLRAELGLGIRDVPVRVEGWRRFFSRTVLAHNWYWAGAEKRPDGPPAPAPPGTIPLALDALHAALGLTYLRKFAFDRWWDEKLEESAAAGKRVAPQAGTGTDP